MGAEAQNTQKEKVHHYLATKRCAIMKYLLLLVIATVAFAAPAEQEIDEDLVNIVEAPEKRNSELLNSLLALPGGIHRSGKRNSELLNSLLALPGGNHRSGKRNSELLNPLLALPGGIHRSGKRNSELLNPLLALPGGIHRSGKRN